MDARSIIVTVIVAMLGSGGMTAIVNWLLTRSGKKNPLYIGMRLLLQDKIEYLGMKYIAEGRITYSQKRMLHAMHDCYHGGLHGNGDLDGIMEDVDEIDVIYPNGKREEKNHEQN
ncbi:MAG: hypothetical protein Q4E65_06845 [Clostridia bacterium]|nr:hypothetical protein [Clostridia bacterium]